MWKNLESKSFMGLSQEYLKGRNYFKEIIFYLTDDTLSDDYVIISKKKIKILLILGVVFFAAFI
jgi:hypothetical protein